MKNTLLNRNVQEKALTTCFVTVKSFHCDLEISLSLKFLLVFAVSRGCEDLAALHPTGRKSDSSKELAHTKR